MNDNSSGKREPPLPERPAEPGTRPLPTADERDAATVVLRPVPVPDARTIVARYDAQATVVKGGAVALASDSGTSGASGSEDLTQTVAYRAENLPVPADLTIAPPTSARRSGGVDTGRASAVLMPGDVLGERYEILDRLGAGGMGAVYKAADRELDRVIALKVIRPELASDREILARFKQELLLSHKVTHRNVIRIYDLSEADGVKFITMEFIEGRDLRSLLQERKKFPHDEAAAIAIQVCQALEAAHTAHIIHRDLKPQNIMLEPTGRVLVMDFGLARTLGSDGMTQTGAFVGTMEYMSPEQALGKEVDQRSDIFAFGLILFELLSGERPFVAESPLASIIKRTQEPAISVSDLDPSVPAGLGRIVSRCLERDLSARYASFSEIRRDLEWWNQGDNPAMPAAPAVLDPAKTRKPASKPNHWTLLAAAVAVLGVGLSGYLLRHRLLAHVGGNTTAVVAPSVSLAILPFRNASSDPALDWIGSSLADMLTTDVGQSARLRTVSPGVLHQILGDLHVSSSTVLDPATIKRAADFSNADRVVWGQYVRFGNAIRIDATLEDIKENRSVSLKVDVPSENDIPAAIDKLAESIRQTLALPKDVLKELKASSFQPTTGSIEALRSYNVGLGLQRDGKNLEAQKQFEAATKADPNFALAFARLAQIYSVLGYDTEADGSAKKAVLLSQNLPEAEKYQISAIELQVLKNFPEAIRAYENLARVQPDNAEVRAALARLYEDSGQLAKAHDYYQKALAVSPKDIGANIDLGRIQIKSGDAQGSLEPLGRAYTLAVQMDNKEQKATSLHLMAVAYRRLDKPQEVLRSEQEALPIWRGIGQQRGLAFSLNELATAQATLGNVKDAMSNFNEALRIRRDIGDKRGLGDTLIDMGNLADDHGDHDGALRMYQEALQLERDIGNDSLVAVCLNNIGSVYSEKGQFQDALTYLQEVLRLREKSKVPQDIVDAEHNLGQALTSMGDYDQAISYFMRALELRRGINDTRGAALESYGLGGLFENQGRFGAALHSKEEALKPFRELKDKTFWMSEILGGYAHGLILAGRMDDAKSPLEEALGVAQQLKNDGLVAQTLGFQGDAQFYKGNYSAAQALYGQAMQAATRSKEPERILQAKIDLAKAAVEEKKGASAVANLRTLMQQADDAGLKYASVECALYLAEAMLQAHDTAHAGQELRRALLRSDKLGQQALSARAHYLLATMAAQTNDRADARDDYRWVLNTLDTMKKDPGAESLLQRADMGRMYSEASNWLKGQ